MRNILNESQTMLSSQWGDLKEGLLAGLEGTKKKNTGVLLENSRIQLNALLESASIGSTTAGNVAMLPKIILPVIRRVAPSVIANDILGVQPLSGPLGYIRTLRASYAETAGSPTPVTAGTEALNPLDIARFYSGNLNSTAPAGANTADLEGTGGKKMKVELKNQAVEVKTRKLSAAWTFEAAQDALAQSEIDIEAEMMALLAQEIASEIDQEMLLKLRTLAGNAGVTYDQGSVSGTATFVGDEHAALATLINFQSNLIATRTRRGPGNWAVVSPTALTILQSATTSALARSTEGTFESPTNVKFVGVLNSTLRVYVDAYADSATPVLVGLKASDVDAAAYYCPYIPLMATPIVIDPATFQPTVSFMTRYGYTEMTNTATSLGNSADYLAKIDINTNNLKFQ